MICYNSESGGSGECIHIAFIDLLRLICTTNLDPWRPHKCEDGESWRHINAVNAADILIRRVRSNGLVCTWPSWRYVPAAVQQFFTPPQLEVDKDVRVVTLPRAAAIAATSVFGLLDVGEEDMRTACSPTVEDGLFWSMLETWLEQKRLSSEISACLTAEGQNSQKDEVPDPDVIFLTPHSSQKA